MNSFLAALGCVFCLVLVATIYLSLRTFAARGDLGISREEREAADLRSQELLRDFLEEREYSQLMECGYLDIASPQNQERTYRIPFTDGLVQVYDRGHLTKRLCLQPAEYLPRPDLIVLHKLMITANEQEYLARANAFPPLYHGW